MNIPKTNHSKESHQPINQITKRIQELFFHIKYMPNMVLNDDVKSNELISMINSYTKIKTLDEKDLYAIYLLTSVYSVNNPFNDKEERLQEAESQTTEYLKTKHRNFHTIFLKKTFNILKNEHFTKKENQNIITNIKELLKNLGYYGDLDGGFSTKHKK